MRESPSESARISAAELILDRAHGRPSTAAGVDMSDLFAGFNDVPSTDDEISMTCKAFAAEALAVLRALAFAGKSSASRIRAGRALLARGKGLPPPASASFDPTSPGKKAAASRAAETAGEGTEWGDDLNPHASPRRDN